MQNKRMNKIHCVSDKRNVHRTINIMLMKTDESATFFLADVG